ncbi:NEDD4-binding protein 2-like 1-like [Homarus americanus]|uniref:NEDD4-binding protein 2-like 1-like n=1 Tax=Homarus americanus TaxID=6706 RepID=A0A8J5JJ53_HOMAM|nr:NEDD4-binding protein 2-like 1-like [Homarus americanus]
MAGTDHGEVLTKFDEIFGKVVEHEVIKMVLQSCDWESKRASELLLAMIDENDLPAYVRNALAADSFVQDSCRKFHSNFPDNDSELQKDSKDLLKFNGDHIDKNSDYQSNKLVRQETNGDEVNFVTPPLVPDIVHHESTYNGMTDIHEDFFKRSEREMCPASPHSSYGGMESECSSPSQSPLKLASLGVDYEVNRERNTSQWVLAPEFVPNALTLNSSANSNGIWPLGMCRSLVQAPQLSSLHSTDKPKPKEKICKKNEIVKKILQGQKVMILMRGLPGSGKTTLAKEIKGRTGVILSTDDFFCDKRGKYNYDPSRINEAHQWNKHRALQKLQDGKTPIIIDNTNLQMWEMKPYVKLGLQYGYEVDILDAETPWKLNAKELARKNIHGVPKGKITEMKGRYDKDIKIEHIITSLRGFQAFNQNSRNDREFFSSDIQTKEDKPTVPSQSIKVRQLIDISLLDPPQENWISIDDSDDDADVVVEGYDSDSEVEEEGVMNLSCVFDGGKIVQEARNNNDTCTSPALKEKMTDEVQADGEVKHEKGGSEEGIGSPIWIDDKLDKILSHSRDDDKIELPENKSMGRELKVTCELEWGDISDEDKIKILIEEANTDVDIVQNETDWFNLTSQDTDEEAVSDQKFSDLVMSFGTIVKAEIEKNVSGSTGIDKSVASVDTVDTHDEDTAMYELCCNVEEKTGKSLSMLVTQAGENEEHNFLLVDGNQDEGGEADKSLFSIISLTEATSNLKINDTDENISSRITRDPVEDHTKLDALIDGKDSVHTSNTEALLVTGEIDMSEQDQVDSRQMCVSSSSEVECQEKLGDEPSECWKEETREDKSTEMSTEDKVLETGNTEFYNEYTPSTINRDPPQDTRDHQPDADSLMSWDCVDVTEGVSSGDWDSSKKVEVSDLEAQSSKPSRTRRKRAPGDPTKWLGDTNEKADIIEDPTIASWNPVQSGTPSWNTTSPHSTSPSKRGTKELHSNISLELQPHTGAVSKFRKRRRHTRSHSAASTSSSHSDEQAASDATNALLNEEKILCDAKKTVQIKSSTAETQTLSIDFEALQLDNNLYELKVLYGQPDYVTKTTIEVLPENGPLTRGKLCLDKSSMTESNLDVTMVESFQNLVAFFPHIPQDDLRDVLEKCKYNLDWAMNVLLDSGYEMSDPTDTNISPAEIKELDLDTESTGDTASTGEGRNDQSSFADASDMSLDMHLEDRSKKIRQSQKLKDLENKKAIENAFTFPESVDDRVTRLTGSDFNDLNMKKVKQMKARKKQGGKKNTPDKKVQSSGSSTNGEGGEGAQYVTLVMDSLFASQLIRMFGPVGSCEVSGELSLEDRSVILPLEICLMIHKNWASTLDGKFEHEAEVLDTLIREDEILARRLQEEENSEAGTRNGKKTEKIDEIFQNDPPSGLQEIMDLEKALQQSQRLYTEYPHVDPDALKEEFTKSDYNYKNTVERLCDQYGSEKGTPKTVYRNEAQLHYNQRQEAFKKAQEASSQGMKAVAAYYARIGNLHSTKLIEANQRASKKILEATNANRKDANSLDLHLLHVPEAVSATQAFLSERQRVLASRGIGQMQVSLITGRGAHSVGGQARLKPAIKEFLQKSGYLFHEVNRGMFLVTLQLQQS